MNASQKVRYEIIAHSDNDVVVGSFRLQRLAIDFASGASWIAEQYRDRNGRRLRIDLSLRRVVR